MDSYVLGTGRLYFENPLSRRPEPPVEGWPEDYNVTLDYSEIEARAIAEMISNPRVYIKPRNQGKTTDMRMNSMMAAALLGAVGMASSPASALAVQPQESTRRLAPVKSRKDKKKADLAAMHMRNARSTYGKRESKLRRRLRRKFELGRSGSF